MNEHDIQVYIKYIDTLIALENRRQKFNIYTIAFLGIMIQASIYNNSQVLLLFISLVALISIFYIAYIKYIIKLKYSIIDDFEKNLSYPFNRKEWSKVVGKTNFILKLTGSNFEQLVYVIIILSCFIIYLGVR